MKIGLDSGALLASVKRVGEKNHEGALGLSRMIARGEHQGICSALVLTEVPGALASATGMPVDKIYETELSLLNDFRVNIRPFEQYADVAVDLMLEFRDLKRKADINSADFHHLATAIGESCEFFFTVDEKRLLRADVREAFSRRIQISSPSDANL